LLPHGIIDLVLNNINKLFMNAKSLIVASAMALAAVAVTAAPQPAGMWDTLVGVKYAKAR
jgi:hypothetical protein